MGRQFIEYLDVDRVYACRKCKLHLTSSAELMSKNFWGATGKAFLFNRIINMTTGEAEERMMRTGLHSVRDLICKGCGQVLGWKYDWASEADQKYKEGKCILEKSYICKVEWN
jgi:hypothetical protein